MAYEYYGWIVLSADEENAPDFDFEAGFDRVRRAIETLPMGLGHEAVLPPLVHFPRVVWLKGHDVPDLMPLLDLVDEIGATFDHAYGELQVIDHGTAPWQWWDFNRVERYRIVNGRVQPPG